jgi:hypothetical protein
MVLVRLQAPPSLGVRGSVATYRSGVSRSGRRQRHLAMDGLGGRGWHRPDRFMMADGEYATWVTIDRYCYRPSDTFVGIFGKTLAQIRAFTRLPGAAVCRSGSRGWPSSGDPGLFAGMRLYATLGLVWLDIAQHQGIYYQDCRIENSPAAEIAFRRGAFTLQQACS